MAAIGVTDMDILFDTEKGRFSYRAAGLAVKEGRLLVQRMRGDQGLAIPGGHVAFGETAAESLRREFREELELNVEIGGLAAVGEVFFDWKGPCQQICLYYRVDLPAAPWEGVRHGFDGNGQVREEMEFLWAPVETIQRDGVVFYPPQLAGHLAEKGILHFVSNQLN